eukprot:CAMPEP_0168579504 /NCGR_PEP_ID=MMETSP0420-20121227/257_1 /TAXON_ID=498008 /ORGANISM="Pessonella sp." /LENGTH=46 /DNA_ID= /DNA_START= /DNA_END= /DNA_ORIENTATION=
MSLDEYHLEESINDLKNEDGETDTEQLQHLLLDVMLDKLCEELART